jgi:DNA repair protein RadA/Sms
MPPHLVACGEVGLGGEIRSVPQLELRLHESYRLGFRSALVPASAQDGPTGLRLLRARTVAEALALCSLAPAA